MENEIVLLQLVKEDNRIKIKETELQYITTSYERYILKDKQNHFYIVYIKDINKLHRDCRNVITVFSMKENIYYNKELIKNKIINSIKK
jgi:hypothetical protein